MSAAPGQRAAERIAAGRREIHWLSQGLAPTLFGGAAAQAALRDFALAHGRARIRVLIADPAQALRSNPALVELARSLTSRFELRVWPETLAQPHEEWLIVDDAVLLRHALPPSREFAETDARTEVRSKLRLFVEAWQQALPAQALRRLHL